MPFPLRDAFRTLTALALAIGLIACSPLEPRPEPAVDDAPAGGLELQLLHFADIDGGGTGALEHVAEFSALVSSFRAEMPERTLLISSGDNYVAGPLYQASNDPAMAGIIDSPGVGRGEIAFLNAMAVDASALGNHDLDGGPEEFAAIIQPDDDGWSGAGFPWLASNLDFSGDPHLAGLVSPDGRKASDIPGRLAGSAVLEIDGRRVGVVGASTPTLDQITSTGEIGVHPDDPDDIDALAGVIQEAVDALAADGVDIIILAAHMQQLRVERELAERLEHVDVVIAGGSNTLLADPDDSLHPGDRPVDGYPLVYRSPLDEPVLLVNTDGDYRYLGRLVLPFDAEGVIDLDRLDDDLVGVWASTASVVETRAGKPMPEVQAIRDAFWQTLEAKEGHVLGYTEQFLDGRRTMVRTRETNLGRVWAEATLWLGRKKEPEAVIAFRNGGGIRGPIGEVRVPPGSRDASTVQLRPPPGNRFRPEGSISRLDLETALAFNGELVALTLTAGELYDIMEYGVSGIEPGATPGWFPQFTGLRVAYDPSRPARRPIEPGKGNINQGVDSNGERIRDLAVVTPDGTTTELVSEGEWVGDPEQRFRVISLAFLAQCVPVADGQNQELSPCGDGYPLRGLSNPQRRDLVGLDYPGVAIDFVTPGTEQYALAAYLAEFHGTLEKAIQLPPQPEGEQAWLVELPRRQE